ncbi:MAG: hypothetical protein H6760_03235 [Candidatus Nomurabacteria bacterium]|nr:MAG: hypothetical protein H6760_03235 [Candidatus Nomurabacteria bacterium]
MAYATPSFFNNASGGRFRGTTHALSHCPLCQAFYQPSTSRILVTSEDAHLIHLECTRCGSSVLAIIVASMVGVSSVGLLTDLTAEDVMKFRLGKEIDANDVLDVHEWVQDASGELIS